MPRPVAVAPMLAVAAISFLLLVSTVRSGEEFSRFSNLRRSASYADGLCANLVEPAGYLCSERTTQTKDGYLLGLQRVSSRTGSLLGQWSPPVLLLHGLFMAGDAWFMDSANQSLGFILADRGFDVWVGNVRGTHWSHGHVSLSVKDKDFWDWSWQELALYDLEAMLRFVNLETSSKVFVVGHSQGTIISLAGFTQPDIVNMVEAAALLSPISYLDHITAPFVLRIVHMHLDEMLVAMGIHQLNFKSQILTDIIDMVCDGHVDCSDLLSSITGTNCCFNNSRVDFYLEYEPHPSSLKNLKHLFQMIRKGTFAKFDYGKWKNLLNYGQTNPPKFDLSQIPDSLPMWMAYGGKDALADVIDVQNMVNELQSKPKLVYLENYGHIDFLLSIKAYEDLYEDIIRFFRSGGKFASY